MEVKWNSIAGADFSFAQIKENDGLPSYISHTSGLILTCQSCNSLTANHTHVKKCPSSPRNWSRVNRGELIKDYNQFCKSCPSAALFNGCICKHPVWFLKKSPPRPLFVWLLSKNQSCLYLISMRSPQTGTHRLLSCVYGAVWLESLSDLPYLELITQLAALVLSWAMQRMWDGVNVQ